MSLINDALKRARHEALRQDSEGGPTVYGAVPAHSRHTRRPWMLVLAGAAVTVVIAAIAWLVLGRAPSPPIAPETPTTQAASQGEPGQLPGPDDGSERAAMTAAPAEQELQSSVDEEPEATSPPPTSRPVVDSPSQQQTVTESDSEARAQSASPAAQPTGERLRAGETYLRRATAADGTRVLLGGIAYSDTLPIAVINGAVVSPGDLIAGFTVVAVEPERVELEADGVRFFLALH